MLSNWVTWGGGGGGVGGLRKMNGYVSLPSVCQLCIPDKHLWELS